MTRNIFFHDKNSRPNATLPSSYLFYQVLQTSFSLTNDITFPHHNSPVSLLSCLITPPNTAYHITSVSPVPPLPCLKPSLLTLLPCLNISCLLCYHVSKRLHPPLLPYLKHLLSTLLPCLKTSPLYPVTLS